MKKLTNTMIAGALLASTTSAMALETDQCDLNVNQNIHVTPSYIEISDQTRPLYRINNAGQISVNGEKLEMTQKQIVISQAFNDQVRIVVPESIELAHKAVGVAKKAVSLAFDELFGEGSQMAANLTDALSEVEEKIDQQFNYKPNHYRIGPDELASIENAFDEDFEKAMEENIEKSMGNIIGMIGEALAEGDGSFEERMQQFGERMEKMGQEIEAEVSEQAGHLEQDVEHLCRGYLTLDQLESTLHANVIELEGFDAISVNAEKLRYQ